ncbi:MAG: N-acyl homoserine lactonase family protein [Clostridia bacterium]|nr:N-acyl homoserine lactonase family protein [Clostridia bacterium]
MSKILGVYALKYAESTVPGSWAFEGGDANEKIPISFTVYLIETETRRILVDAGCDTMPGFDMKYFVSPVEILERRGYSPEDITDVILTHAHHDHIEAVHYFKNAAIHIQSLEYEASQRKHKYIPEGFDLHLFDEIARIGDVTVRCIAGHAKGSCIVEFELDGKPYVISGDECYARRCLTERIPTGSSVNPEKSRAFVEKYGDEKYTVLLCHDPDILPGQNGVLKIF